ncbi:hypothetical protein [Halobellus sp. GM3]|uniref:hypothetical protein n=1 Tax=Halobellus sp. GM3 TaxID=3458410 RepID=UPI00403D6220
MIGRDPDKLAIIIHQVSKSGSIVSLHSIPFYQKAPISFILPAMYRSISDVHSQYSLLTHTVSLGVLAPIIASQISYKLDENRKNSIIAAAITTVATSTYHYSFWPVNQSLGVVIWMLFLFSLIKYYSTKDPKIFLIGILFLVLSSITHKLPPLIVFLSLLMFGIIVFIDRLWGRSINQINLSQITIVFGISALVVYAQLGNTILGFVIRTVLEVLSLSEPSYIPQYQPVAAVNPFPNWMWIGIRRGHALLLLPLSGLSWLLLYKRDRSLPSTLILSASAGIVILLSATTLAGLNDAPTFRILMTIEFIVIPLVITQIIDGNFNDRISIKTLSTTILVFLLIFLQIFSATAIPDHPVGQRNYLNEQEVAAKDFGDEWVVGSIYTDLFTQQEATPSSISNGQISQKYISMEKELLNKNISSKNQSCLLINTAREWHTTEYGTFRLIWDVQESMMKKYSRTYHNGDSSFFKSQKGC